MIIYDVSRTAEPPSVHIKDIPYSIPFRGEAHGWSGIFMKIGSVHLTILVFLTDTSTAWQNVDTWTFKNYKLYKDHELILRGE